MSHFHTINRLIEATSLLATPLAGIAFVTFTTLYALAKCLSYRSLHFRPAASVTSPPKVETRHKPMWFMTVSFFKVSFFGVASASLVNSQ